MAERAVVLALANPDPEVDPIEAQRHAAVVGTGRSDYPNQINNVLAFPGVFRGLLDAGAREITDEMLVAAARAIADAVRPGELNAELHRAERVRPAGGARGRGRRPRGGRGLGPGPHGPRRARDWVSRRVLGSLRPTDWWPGRGSG